VLTNTSSEAIYLPIKFTYTTDTFVNHTNISYVGNSQLIKSIEDGMFKEEFTYDGDKLLRSVESQKTSPTNWTVRNSYTYALNVNGDITRKNQFHADTLLIGYWLANYNSSRKIVKIESYNVVKSIGTLNRKMEFEYDAAGNIKTAAITSYYGTTPSVSTYSYEYDNKNGIFKHVKNQLLLFSNTKWAAHQANNMLKEFSGETVVTAANEYNEYNTSGYPTKFANIDPTASTAPVNIVVDYTIR